MNVTTEIVDERGVKRRVLIPDYTANPHEGIVVSLQLDAQLAHAPPEFLRHLTDELWARRLVEPHDFFKPNALRDITSALAAAFRLDAIEIQNQAKEQMTNV